MLYFRFRECELRKVILVPNLPYFLTFSHLFYGMELTMCGRNGHSNRSFKLACFDAAKDGRSGVYELRFTIGLAEGVFPCYRVVQGADRLVGWLLDREGFYPKSPVAEDKARRHP